MADTDIDRAATRSISKLWHSRAMGLYASTQRRGKELTAAHHVDVLA